MSAVEFAKQRGHLHGIESREERLRSRSSANARAMSLPLNNTQ